MNCEISGWDQFWRYGFFSLFAEDVLVKEVRILLLVSPIPPVSRPGIPNLPAFALRRRAPGEYGNDNQPS